MLKEKKHVGRPSNDEIKARRNKKIFIVAIAIFVVIAIAGILETGTLANLMGNSVVNYSCSEGYTLSGDKCTRIVYEKAYYIGDVNQDGAVDVLDVTSMKKYFSGTANYNEYQLILADVNKDGAFDVSDETILNKYISGMASGSSSATHYIGRRACPKDYRLSGSQCRKTEVIDAIVEDSSVSGNNS